MEAIDGHGKVVIHARNTAQGIVSIFADANGLKVAERTPTVVHLMSATGAASTGATVTPIGATRSVQVVKTGTGDIQSVVDGSNDGTNWYPIQTASASVIYQVTLPTRFLRTRITEVSGTATLEVRLYS